MTMMTESEARIALRALAQDLEDRLGASPEFVYGRHLKVFAGLRRRRVPWSVIARFCREEGVLETDDAKAARTLASRVARAARRQGVPLGSGGGAPQREATPALAIVEREASSAGRTPSARSAPVAAVDLSADELLDRL